MDETRGQRNGKMTKRPLNTDDKAEVLRKLQESSRVHFEKTLSASHVQQKGRPKLTIPMWFVQEHGDKLLKHVVLRCQSSLPSWTVRLSIELRTPTCVIVTFGAGWQEFVSFHGLLEGDSVVFSLTAMSEFEVYLFRDESGIPKEFLSLAPRERSNDSERARKKVKLPRECRDEQFVADGKVKGLAKSTSLIAEKKINGHFEELPACTSSQSPASFHLSSHSNDLHLHESENNRDCSSGDRSDLRIGRETAIDHDKLDMMSGVDTKDGPARHSDVKTKKERAYQASALEEESLNPKLPRFVKKLGVSNICLPGNGRSEAFMEIPARFWKKYSSRLHSVVNLQWIREDSNVPPVNCRLFFKERQTRLYLRTGWDSFAADNNLEVGQELVFTLTGDSFFAVRKALWAPIT